MDELPGNLGSATDPEAALTVRTRFDGAVHTVELSGELDIATGSLVVGACTSPRHRHVIVDLTALTFMDCAGYRAIVIATSLLEHRGGSLVVTNAVGEPRRLLTLIDQLEHDGGRAARLNGARTDGG